MTANDNDPEFGPLSVEAVALLMTLYQEGPNSWLPVVVGDALVICELKGWVECGKGVPNSDCVMTRLTDVGRQSARDAKAIIEGGR